MNVLHICSYYTNSKLYQNLIKYLDKKNIYNTVYVPIKNKCDYNKYKIEDLCNSQFIYSKCFYNIDRVNFFIKEYKIYKSLNQSINDFANIDIVHAHSLFTNGYIAYRLKKEKNIDYIVAVRSTDIEIFFKKMIHLRSLGIKILKNSKKIIFISPAYKKKCLEKYIPENLIESINKKSIVIPNGIEEFWFDSINQHNVIKYKKQIDLIYVGQLIRRKNIKNSILTCNKLNDMGINCRLKIIGSGKLYKKLKKEEYKSNSKVEIIDFLSKEELIQQYKKSDIFVMPSKQETFGLVYVEAMSQGLPVIYSTDEGFDGYFDDGRVGYSVIPDNIDDICNKILQIKSSYEDISLNALKESKKFMWKDICNLYIDIYDNIKTNDK